MLVAHGRQGRHLGDDAARHQHAMLRIGNVQRVVVKGREGADDADEHGHWMRGAREAVEKLVDLLIHHGVVANIVLELEFLAGVGQFAVQEQIAGFQIA